MHILFLMPAAPLADNISGAASRYLQNLKALTATGASITLARLDSADHFAALPPPSDLPPVNSEGEKRTSSVGAGGINAAPTATPPYEPLDFRYDPPRLNRLQRWLGALFEPIGVVYPSIDQATIRIGALLDEIDPDLVWVETTELAASVMLANPAVTWILSHHDLAYRVREIRTGAKTRAQRWTIDMLRRAETTVIQSAPIIITASMTDAGRLRALGAPDVRVIPMGYDPQPVATGGESPAPTASAGRIIHLGSLETTANRVGLEAYLRKAHPQVPDTTLTIIGSANALKPPLRDLIDGDPRVVLAGYQPDLDSALHPFDLAILPYEHDTGYRTKLPLLMRHQQVIVTTRAAVAGSIIDGLDHVIVIVERVDDFPDVIRRLWDDHAERERIGRAALVFFTAHYTHDAIQPHYTALLDEIIE